MSKRAWLVTRGKISSACVLQTLCRPNKASFFHLSAFLRCKIVIKRDKVLTWLGSSCFLSQVLEKTRSIDLYWFGWLCENRTFISIAFLREKFSSGSVQKVPLFWGMATNCKGIRDNFRNNLSVYIDFALLQFNCLLYNTSLSSLVFLFFFHASNHFCNRMENVTCENVEHEKEDALSAKKNYVHFQTIYVLIRWISPQSLLFQEYKSPHWGKNPKVCFTLTVCRHSRASFFHWSAFVSYTIVITRGKVLIWVNSYCFLSEVLQLKRSVIKYWFCGLNENQTFISMVVSRKSSFWSFV